MSHHGPDPGHHGMNDHGHDHGHDHHHHYPWYPGFPYAYWGWGWDSDWWWDRYYYYNGCYPVDFFSYWPSYFNGSRPYACNYFYDYDADPYASYDASAPVPPAPPPAGADSTAQAAPALPPAQGEGSEAAQFFTEATTAFKDADYRDALRLTSHAAVESPQNPKVHELMSLALFALKDYRGAAVAAHAALAMATPPDWDGLYAYYGNAEKYTTQMRALEKYVSEHSSSAPARFLLGYHYLMVGSRAEAKPQFAQAVKLTPNDKLAAHLLRQLEADQPITPPPEPAKDTKQPKQSGELL